MTECTTKLKFDENGVVTDFHLESHKFTDGKCDWCGLQVEGFDEYVKHQAVVSVDTETGEVKVNTPPKG